MAQIRHKEWLDAQYGDAGNLNARMNLHLRFSTNPIGWQQWVWDHLDLPADATILEVGCGPGTLWATNQERILPGWRAVLSDRSPGMVARAQATLSAHHPRIDFAVADAQWLPLADESCHAVIANHMLYHVADRTLAFAEICRVLRPGGKLYAATNGKGHMAELHELVRRCWGADAPPDLGRSGFAFAEAEAELNQWFDHVRLFPYDNPLVVPEAGPLVDYVFSGAPGAADPERRDEFRNLVSRELAAHGPIVIQTETGLFAARR